MPPRGTTGKSSSTGARGPTGPRGEARTSPAGSGGGKAGSVSRTSSGARGPTGPKGQARTAPTRSGGGGGGGGGGLFSGGYTAPKSAQRPASTTNAGPKNRLGNRNVLGGRGVTALGGTSAPKARAVPPGRMPSAQPIPPGPKSPARRPTPTPDDFTGSRFGNPSNDVMDTRKTPKLSTSFGDRARAAAYRMKMLGNTIGDAFNTNKEFLGETSRLTPNVRLPSRRSSAFGQIYEGGGLVTKKGRVPPKGKK